MGERILSSHNSENRCADSAGSAPLQQVQMSSGPTALTLCPCSYFLFVNTGNTPGPVACSTTYSLLWSGCTQHNTKFRKQIPNVQKGIIVCVALALACLPVPTVPRFYPHRIQAHQNEFSLSNVSSLLPDECTVCRYLAALRFLCCWALMCFIFGHTKSAAMDPPVCMLSHTREKGTA